MFQCIADKCTNTGSASGHISTSNCMSCQCLSTIAPLYRTGSAQNRCFDCMAYTVSSGMPIDQAQKICAQTPGDAWAFDGMTSSMILSHYPLSRTQTYFLPGTGYRHAVHYAQVQLEENQTVDFYCAQLISPLIDALLPYSGNYGQDRTDGGTVVENGWQDEQDLQVDRAIAFIKKTSAASGRPAIIAGDWHSSTHAEEPDGGGVIVGDLSPEVMAELGSAFGPPQEPQDYVEACNACPTNPWLKTAPLDLTHTFLSGFAAGSVTDDELWDTTANVPINSVLCESAPNSGSGPIFEYFPRVVYVLRPHTQ